MEKLKSVETSKTDQKAMWYIILETLIVRTKDVSKLALEAIQHKEPQPNLWLDLSHLNKIMNKRIRPGFTM